jgi:hypothetical protein
VLRLPSLTSLNVAGNGFSTLPVNLFTSLSALEVLDVSHNSLSNLPDGIANCTKLRVLTLMANILTSLPKGIDQVSSLEELHARYCCSEPVSVSVSVITANLYRSRLSETVWRPEPRRRRSTSWRT